ncbi:MAG: phasin [Rhizobiales bacterium]|nr:phasin [Hyphomicrobiales bacterium]
MADMKKPAKTATQAFEQAGEAIKAEFAKFPTFEVPRFEVPAGYRELAEKNIAQAKQNYERVKAVAEETSELVETTCANAIRGVAEYNLKLVEAARANINAHFDFARDLLTVKSPSEAVELSSTHARKQFDAISAQGKELASLAQKVSTDAAEPMKTGFNRALRVVA